MTHRDDMEGALKAKINNLLQKIEDGKTRETELKEKIRANYEHTKTEEALLPELHTKLKKLEETLRQKEKANADLRRELLDKEQEADCIEEYWKREQNFTNQNKTKTEQTRQKYGDILIETNQLRNKSDDLCFEITNIEKKLREEEDFHGAEEQRVQMLQIELDSVTAQLNTMQQHQDELKNRDEIQNEKLKKFREKQNETEEEANKIESEVKTMELTLDILTEKLAQMKTEHQKLDTILMVEKRKIEERETLEKKEIGLKKTDLHKAQKIRSAKK